ncbi:MAG: hypothetical protein HY244_12565, partial [Rhizobiales bacterium]|nr:hypothetical protein [Hyphomicrobiales bacterium]
MVDVSIAGQAAPAGIAANPDIKSSVLLRILASAAMVLALLLPAIWNGFPLIFPDTGGYVERPFLGTLDMGRSALFGLYLDAGIPTAFWANVIAQSALTVWLIVLSLRALALGGRPGLALAIVAMLAIGTSLPWFAGQLMPDILFPAAVLALYLLAFRAAELAAGERGALVAVIVFAVPSHMAAAGMCVGLLIALWLFARLAPNLLPKPKLSLAAAAVVAGVALCPVSNYAIAGKFVFTPGGSSFLFGRLVEDGIIARYLDERCPDAALRLCAHKDALPDEADDWLWGDSPFYTLGGWKGYSDEERVIILDTLKRYPLMHATTAVIAAAKQFVAFQTEISIEDNGPTIETFAAQTPQLGPQFMRARQQTDHFSVAPLNVLHVPIAGLSIAGLALALLARR